MPNFIMTRKNMAFETVLLNVQFLYTFIFAEMIFFPFSFFY